jgi:8-oxo-dGTP diphosphatase
MINPGFTLCFLLHGEEVLMLHRRFPPNQGLWNGVGGHIELRETSRQAVIREVAEETGYKLENPQFAGLLTWDGYEIPPGGIVIYTATVPHKNFIKNHEGDLKWVPKKWACTSPEVVDNIHVFLPRILAGEPPLHYHFSYKDGVRVKDLVKALPEELDLDQPFAPGMDLFEERRGEYLLSFDKERLQLDVIEDFLANQSYWAQGRSGEVIQRSIQNSVCLGIYCQGVQVGFARLVTDQATFAWLCDVFVHPNHREQGLGKWLLEGACRYADGKGIKRTLLATRDAHGLYVNHGDFSPLEEPSKWLTRLHPDYNKDGSG